MMKRKGSECARTVSLERSPLWQEKASSSLVSYCHGKPLRVRRCNSSVAVARSGRYLCYGIKVGTQLRSSERSVETYVGAVCHLEHCDGFGSLPSCTTLGPR